MYPFTHSLIIIIKNAGEMIIRTKWHLQRKGFVNLTGENGGIADQAQRDNATAIELEKRAQLQREADARDKIKKKEAALVLWSKIKEVLYYIPPCSHIVITLILTLTITGGIGRERRECSISMQK